MGLRSALLLVSVALAGCAPMPVEDDGGDAARPRDSGLPVGATAADGGGVCCPIGYFVCDCGSAGGWAPDGASCDDPSHDAPCDVAEFHAEVDAHGCPIEVPVPLHAGARCCNCPDLGPPHDAGPDLGWDGGFDAGVDAYHPGF